LLLLDINRIATEVTMALSPSWGFATAIVIGILSAVYRIYHTSLLSALSPSLHASICRSTATTHPGDVGYGYAEKPHHSSWDAWWHPQRSQGRNEKSKDGAGVMTEDWNILYHLGGNGPWVEKVIDVVEGGVATPEGCEVVQVHMVCFRLSLLLED
jgi:acid phosphatase